jgi:hypothetical protein
MPATTNKDLQITVNNLELKVNSLAQRQDEVVIPGIEAIKKKMDTFSYVHQQDYDKDRDFQQKVNGDVETRLDELEKIVNAGGVKVANALNSGVSKAIISILVVTILGFIILNAAKVIPALGAS